MKILEKSPVSFAIIGGHADIYLDTLIWNVLKVLADERWDIKSKRDPLTVSSIIDAVACSHYRFNTKRSRVHRISTDFVLLTAHQHVKARDRSALTIRLYPTVIVDGLSDEIHSDITRLPNVRRNNSKYTSGNEILAGWQWTKNKNITTGVYWNAILNSRNDLFL